MTTAPSTAAGGMSRRMTAVVWTLRAVVGATFVVSGLAKAIDPWGFMFKIEEYLAAWGWDVPRSIELVGAIALSAFEFLFGLFLATGCFKRLSPLMLTASMALMLPLTAYIFISDPVDDCGCFGDLMRLSNGATFAKNVVLTAALIFLCVFNGRLRRGLFRPAVQWMAATVSFIYLLAVALFGYNVQPMIDFRPYPEGTRLVADAATATDDADLGFIYEKDGRRAVFTLDALPDSTWTFVDREGTSSEDDVRALSVYDGDEDVTDAVLSADGPQLLLVIPEPDRVDISYTYAANQLAMRVEADGGTMTGLLAASPEGIARWTDLSMAAYPCYTVEDTSLKELARGTMSLVYTVDGVIRWKRTMSSFEFPVIEAVERGERSLDTLGAGGDRLFVILTAAWLALLALIGLSQIIHRRLNRCHLSAADVTKTEKKM